MKKLGTGALKKAVLGDVVWKPGVSKARIKRIIKELSLTELDKLTLGLRAFLNPSVLGDPETLRDILLQKPQWYIIGKELLTAKKRGKREKYAPMFPETGGSDED